MNTPHSSLLVASHPELSERFHEFFRGYKLLLTADKAGFEPLTPLIILSVVFVLVALRQFLPLRVQVWQVFLAGALLSVVSGSITIRDAVRAINPDVMLFLFGMFVVGEALVESGYLYALSFRFFSSARTTGGLVALILVVFGLFSALLMNDTLAVIGTPLILYFAEKDDIPRIRSSSLRSASPPRSGARSAP